MNPTLLAISLVRQICLDPKQLSAQGFLSSCLPVLGIIISNIVHCLYGPWDVLVRPFSEVLFIAFSFLAWAIMCWVVLGHCWLLISPLFPLVIVSCRCHVVPTHLGRGVGSPWWFTGWLWVLGEDMMSGLCWNISEIYSVWLLFWFQSQCLYSVSAFPSPFLTCCQLRFFYTLLLLHPACELILTSLDSTCHPLFLLLYWQCCPLHIMS